VVSSGGIDAFADRPDGKKDTWKHPDNEYYFKIEEHVQYLNRESSEFSGVFADRWSDVLLKGIGDAGTLKELLYGADGAKVDASIWGSKPSDWEESRLWQQLQTVAKLAQTHPNRTTDRDVFYVECKLMMV
jgi:hypothetical protein